MVGRDRTTLARAEAETGVPAPARNPDNNRRVGYTLEQVQAEHDVAAPDADLHSVGPENFEWIVQNVAEMAVAKALSAEDPRNEYKWSRFLNAGI